LVLREIEVLREMKAEGFLATQATNSKEEDQGPGSRTEIRGGNLVDDGQHGAQLIGGRTRHRGVVDTARPDVDSPRDRADES
jgi:hypothetical protein